MAVPIRAADACPVAARAIPVALVRGDLGGEHEVRELQGADRVLLASHDSFAGPAVTKGTADTGTAALAVVDALVRGGLIVCVGGALVAGNHVGRADADVGPASDDADVRGEAGQGGAAPGLEITAALRVLRGIANGEGECSAHLVAIEVGTESAICGSSELARQGPFKANIRHWRFFSSPYQPEGRLARGTSERRRSGTRAQAGLRMSGTAGRIRANPSCPEGRGEWVAAMDLFQYIIYCQYVTAACTPETPPQSWHPSYIPSGTYLGYERTGGVGAHWAKNALPQNPLDCGLLSHRHNAHQSQKEKFNHIVAGGVSCLISSRFCGFERIRQQCDTCDRCDRRPRAGHRNNARTTTSLA